MRVSSIIAADNAGSADADFQALFAKVRAAASADLTAYKRGPAWSETPVELILKLYSDENTPPFNISKVVFNPSRYSMK